MPNLTYTDPFLGRLVTDDREQAAINYVESIAVLSQDWRDRLVVLRVYIAICLESQKGGEDDVYSTKLKSYQKEFDTTLILAKQSNQNGITVPPLYPSLSADASR